MAHDSLRLEIDSAQTYVHPLLAPDLPVFAMGFASLVFRGLWIGTKEGESSSIRRKFKGHDWALILGICDRVRFAKGESLAEMPEVYSPLLTRPGSIGNEGDTVFLRMPARMIVSRVSGGELSRRVLFASVG